MPIFFTYSHEDKEFVDRLAYQLVERRAWVWIDRWELKVGDSFVERVQAAIQEATAVIVVLSPASVASNWVKRELASVIYKEVENQLSLVIPILVRDCEIPVFLKGRLYADFRKNFDEGLHVLLPALADVTNATQGRIDSPEFLTDWSIDWGTLNGKVCFVLTLIEHAKAGDFSMLTQVEILGNDAATSRYHAFEKEGFAWVHQGAVLDQLAAWAAQTELTALLTDSRPVTQRLMMGDSSLPIRYRVDISSRWVGRDTGNDILVRVDNHLASLAQRWRATVRPPSKSELMQLAALLVRLSR